MKKILNLDRKFVIDAKFELFHRFYLISEDYQGPSDAVNI